MYLKQIRRQPFYRALFREKVHDPTFNFHSLRGLY